jgi:uncharacterized protein involved in exopolysaccharide biosynthesis
MSEQSFNQVLADEISLKDIAQFFLESWKVITLSGIVGVLLASGYAFIAPIKYQATAHIQVAKVAGEDVEASSVLIEKLNMPMYFSATTLSVCNMMDKLEPGTLIAKKLNPNMIKAGNIITISYKDESPEAAQKCLEGVFNEIRNNQNLMAKPIIEGNKNLLISLKNKLNKAEKTLKEIPIKNLSFDSSESNFSASTLLLATFLNKEEGNKDLKIEISKLETMLTEPKTKEAFLIMPIYAPKQKVSPSGSFIMVSGLLVGVFLGLLFMMGRRSWLAYKASN